MGVGVGRELVPHSAYLCSSLNGAKPPTGRVMTVKLYKFSMPMLIFGYLSSTSRLNQNWWTRTQ